MKQLFLTILLYLSLVSGVTVAADSATEQKIEPALTGQSFCGVRQHQDAPAKKDAGSIESLFEVDLFQSHFDKDCLVVIGLKGWANTWSLPIPLPSLGVAYNQDTAILFKSGTELTMMPTLTFRYKNLYLSANRFFKTDYTFGTQKIDSLFSGLYGRDSVLVGFEDGNGNILYFGAPAGGNSPLAVKIPIEITPTADRSEWDLTLGYYFNEYLALTVGYKKIQRNYQYHLNFPPINVTQSVYENGRVTTVNDNYPWGNWKGDVHSESTGSGMTIGILGAVPVRGKLSLYGNLAYGWLNTEISSGSDVGNLPSFVSDTIVPKSYKEYDTPYYSGEVGLAYQLAHFKEVGFSTYLGYRFQRYEFEDATESGQTARDGTDGFIISFSAYF